MGQSDEEGETRTGERMNSTGRAMRRGSRFVGNSAVECDGFKERGVVRALLEMLAITEVSIHRFAAELHTCNRLPTGGQAHVFLATAGSDDSETPPFFASLTRSLCRCPC